MGGHPGGAAPDIAVGQAAQASGRGVVDDSKAPLVPDDADAGLLPPGSFACPLEWRGGPGAQSEVPWVVPGIEALQGLLAP